MFREFSFTYGALVSIFLATIYLYVVQPAKWSRDVTCLFVAGAVPLGLLGVAFMKYGIWLNHAYEPIMFMMLAIATFWRRETESVARLSVASLGNVAAVVAYIALFSLAQTALTVYVNHSILWHPERDWLQIETQERVVQALQSALDRHPGSQVFAYWMPYVNVRLFENVVVPQVEIVGHCTYPRGVFRYDRFVAGIKSRQIRFVVTASRQKLTSYAGADLRTFEPHTRIGDYLIFMQRD